LRRIFPTPAEASTLRFLIPLGGLGRRLVLAGVLFAAGFSLSCLGGGVLVQRLGLAILLAGHLPLWVRTVTTSPGGATPAHEEVWAPVEDAWLERVVAHERRGERWDTTPWDVTNLQGKIVLGGLLLLLAVIPYQAGLRLGVEILHRAGATMPFLLVPLWFNGMRTVWNPSELRLKGEALATARREVEGRVEGLFDLVPTLALRQGARGSYPVDARLMLRPAQEDGSGFLGIQFQVSINSVKGTDYPYFYAVVLGRGDYRLPQRPPARSVEGTSLVYEQGEKEGVRFLVIRQHADRQGGWHTAPEQIRTIAAEALRLGAPPRPPSGRGSA
jgi:hypothetical protein